MSAVAAADMYDDNAFNIKLGMVLAALGAAFIGPFTGVICVQLKRIEGQHSPRTYTTLALGAVLILEFLYPYWSFKRQRGGAIATPNSFCCSMIWAG